METIENKTSIIINSKAENVYNLITVPHNWIGLHPVTQNVYGPDINSIADRNKVWIEHIVNEDGPQTVNAVWFVTQAVSCELWEIKSAFYGGMDVTITITYYFEEINNQTTFTRIMKTETPDGYLDAKQKGAFAHTEVHQEYLERIKNKIEGNK